MTTIVEITKRERDNGNLYAHYFLLKRDSVNLLSCLLFHFQNCCGIRELGKFSVNPAVKATSDDLAVLRQSIKDFAISQASPNGFGILHLTTTRIGRPFHVKMYGEEHTRLTEQRKPILDQVDTPEWVTEFAEGWEVKTVHPWTYNPNSGKELQMYTISVNP